MIYSVVCFVYTFSIVFIQHITFLPCWFWFLVAPARDSSSVILNPRPYILLMVTSTLNFYILVYITKSLWYCTSLSDRLGKTMYIMQLQSCLVSPCHCTFSALLKLKVNFIKDGRDRATLFQILHYYKLIRYFLHKLIILCSRFSKSFWRLLFWTFKP